MIIGLPEFFQTSGLSPEVRNYLLLFVEDRDKELLLHKDPGGLWEPDGKKGDWRNVTEHCLMVAARADMLGRFLNLPKDVQEGLDSAAMLHDFYKRREIEMMKNGTIAGGDGLVIAWTAGKESEKILRRAGFSELVISLVGCVGGFPQIILRMKEILDAPDLKPEDVAHLALHYIDGYTNGSSLAEPAVEEGDKIINDVDRRNKKNAERYSELAKQSPPEYKDHPFFGKMTLFEAQAAMSHLIEVRITEILHDNGGRSIKSQLHLPEYIDECIIEAAA
ncbi:MAG: hypothetical protein Q7R98_02075 [Candidatus Jorgensenbacteria bacterium]|nr:hypothetical protein [Candidatus Jorgensenbacteria bacterium]